MNALKTLAAVALAAASAVAVAQDAKTTDAISMDDLLNKVRAGRVADAAANKAREQAFLADQARQEALIRQAEARIAALEADSAALEETFNANELLVEDKRKQRDERLGSLKELFGHLTAGAGDLRQRLRTSITSSQFTDRQDTLDALIRKLGDDTELPTLEDIEGLWFEYHREMTESGRVVKYTAPVGTEDAREIVRIGQFNLVSNGDYLAFDDQTQTVSVLPRQPDAFVAGAAALQNATDGVVPVGIDPTGSAGGGYLKALINTPTLTERWHQGKLVGYVITAVGVFGLLLTAWRMLSLSTVAAKVRKQLGSDAAADDNPLGRVLMAAEAHVNDDVETLELKLGEAIIKERPAINRGLAVIKIISMVAPLLGLLGTVTGMIIVFQAITIYGAGDPKAMAGGISSALVTTVLGLIVAIPMLLSHTLLHGRARGLLHILEEQSAGIIAARAGR